MSLKRSLVETIEYMALRMRHEQSGIAISTKYCIATAWIYVHRYFMVHSLADNVEDRYLVAAACLFLAAKVTETSVPAKKCVVQLYQARSGELIDRKSENFVEKLNLDCQKLFEYEADVISSCGLAFADVPLPFGLVQRSVTVLQSVLDEPISAETHKDLVRDAESFALDALRGGLCLEFPVSSLALGAVSLSALQHLQPAYHKKKKKEWLVKCSEDMSDVFDDDSRPSPNLLRRVSSKILASAKSTREAKGDTTPTVTSSPVVASSSNIDHASKDVKMAATKQVNPPTVAGAPGRVAPKLPPLRPGPWEDGHVETVQGSQAKPYILRREGNVYSCTCPQWAQLGDRGFPRHKRTCKHLCHVLVHTFERQRIGNSVVNEIVLAGGGCSRPNSRPASRPGSRGPVCERPQARIKAVNATPGASQCVSEPERVDPGKKHAVERTTSALAAVVRSDAVNSSPRILNISNHSESGQVVAGDNSSVRPTGDNAVEDVEVGQKRPSPRDADTDLVEKKRIH